MASVDQTIVATALPALQHDLAAPVNWSSWTLTIYALGQIMMMPLAGKLGDHYGRKRVFLAAAVLFTGASLACGFAGNIYLLVILRAVQAIGGGAFLPSATGIVADQFGRDRDRALGLFSSVFPIGGIIGPVLGGVFVTYWSWRGIFLVNVPIGLVLIGLGAVFIPRLPRTAKGPLDLPGVALLGGTLLAAMFGVASLGSGTSPHGARVPAPRGPRRHPADPVRPARARATAPFIPAKFLVGRRLRGDEPDQLPVRLRGPRLRRAGPALRREPVRHPHPGAPARCSPPARSAWSRWPPPRSTTCAGPATGGRWWPASPARRRACWFCPPARRPG